MNGQNPGKAVAAVELLELTALELSRKIKSGEITVKDGVEAVINRIKEAEPVIHSYI